MAVTGRILAIDDPVESDWQRGWWQSLGCGDERHGHQTPAAVRAAFTAAVDAAA